jgi:hypothetical protein
MIDFESLSSIPAHASYLASSRLTRKPQEALGCGSSTSSARDGESARSSDALVSGASSCWINPAPRVTTQMANATCLGATRSLGDRSRGVHPNQRGTAAFCLAPLDRQQDGIAFWTIGRSVCGIFGALVRRRPSASAGLFIAIAIRAEVPSWGLLLADQPVERLVVGGQRDDRP